MQTRQATIANPQGIHCRPSALIVKEFMSYPGKITITNENGSVDLSSVLQLLSLEMHLGNTVVVTVEGENEEQVADRLLELFQTRFDFPPMP
ncbi:MAG: HPr family phosphocarrier protein [Verrucomicrobiota bacterium]|jgi:phosphocarrier protein|nr:HPr family phosphocarrier protein [Verrucomicrobiota bacterium]